MKQDVIEALEAIEQAARGNERMETLAKVDSPTLRAIFNYVLSPDITFGIKKVPPEIPSQSVIMSRKEWWPECQDILEELAARRLTGNAMKSRVGSFLGLCDPIEKKWTERILVQDLRLALGATDINKMLPGTIRQFKIPLAKPFKELKSLTGTWFYQHKLDGGRVVARVDKKGNVKLISRSGLEWSRGFDAVKEGVKFMVNNMGLTDVTFDGEVVIYKNGRMDFQAIQKMFHIKDDRKPEGELHYVMFDFARGTEYDSPTKTYEERFNDLNGVCSGSMPPNFAIAVSEKLVNPEKAYLDDKAREFVEMFGTDGGILRRADKVPSNKKSTDIIKVKPFEDGEAVIEEKVEGTGWLVGSLGLIVCRMLVDGKPSGPKFGIGTGEGLTKELRQELWDDPELVGKIVNFKFQRLSDDGVPILNTYRAIRHPNDM